MSLVLRHMLAGDIDQVMVIEDRVFPDPWKPRAFLHEVNRSLVSHMVVLERNDSRQPTRVTPVRWLAQKLQKPNPSQIVGYGGLWKIEDESHISTIASHPDERGKKYGELLLACMIQRAIGLGAAYMVLEVRTSNVIAQTLYEKYGFEAVYTKKKYYPNGEDAYDMRLDFRDHRTIGRIESLAQQVWQAVSFVDCYTTAPHPRFG